MIAPSAWTARPSPPVFTSEADLPRFHFSLEEEVTEGLWRERWLMAVVFLAVLTVGVVVAFGLKATYPAHASLLVRLGQEYVYEPRIGDAGRGFVPSTDQVIQSEVEILSSPDLHRKVVDELGAPRVEPKLARKFAAASPQVRSTMAAEVASDLDRGLKVESAPDNSIIRLTYQAKDPDVATLVLNQLVETYLTYRKTVLIDGAQPATAEQRGIMEQRLAQADNALQSFMADNQIGDFESEKTALSQLRASLVDENYRVQARLSEIGGRLGEIDHQAATVSPEISLYKDSNPAPNDKLMTLKLQRQDLLSRYKADSQPVQDVDRQIADLQGMIASGAAAGPGAQRQGPNPVFQAVQTEKLQLTAEGASLRQRQAELAKQIGQINQQQLRLLALEPRYQELARERDVLSDNVKSLASKAEEDQAAQAIAQKSNDNIRVVEPATADLHGKSLRQPALVLSVLFAAFTALCAGLLKVFIEPGRGGPLDIARDHDLPVLATAELKPRVR